MLRHVLRLSTLQLGALFLLRSAEPIATLHLQGPVEDRIEIPASVNGHGPFPFLLDTGAVNVLSLELASKLSVPMQGRQTLLAFGGSVVAGSATLASLSLDNLLLNNTKIQVLGGGPFQPGGPVGLLGFELLSRYVTELDFDNGTLRLFAPETYTYSGDGTHLPLRIRGNVLSVPVRVAGAEGEMQLDTGSNRSAILFRRFVRDNHLLQRLRPRVEGVTGFGFGGPTRASLARTSLLQLGLYSLPETVVDLSTEDNGTAAGAALVTGNLGEPLLSRFNLVIDVPHRVLYLKPNSSFATREVSDHTGIVTDIRSGHLVVAGVFSSTPAAEAGIAVGDELADAHRQPMSEDDWHQQSRGPVGSVLSLQVKHAGQWRTLHLKLAEYI